MVRVDSSIIMQKLVVLFALLFSIAFFAQGEEAGKIVERRESFVSGGKKIGVQVFAKEGKDRRAAILVLHSSAGTLFGKAEMEAIARRYAREGYVAFFVHYFDRTGTKFAGAAAIDRKWPVWQETVQDAMNYVARNPAVKPKEIGMFGFSLGAYLAVSVGSQDPRVKAVAEVAGGVFLHNERNMHRMPPILVLHGEADQRVPIRYSRELVQEIRALGRKPVVHYYPGEQHVLSPAAIADATERSVKFFRKNLPVR
jgi:carboxymethylenebutenolidase